MLKIIGMILMVTAGIGIGYEKSRVLSRREKVLESLLHMETLLKGEIRCSNASLYDAFCEMGEKLTGEYGEFLKETAVQMRNQTGEPFGEIFRRCAEKREFLQVLSLEEREGFLSLGEHLGYLDKEMQLRQLDLYEEELIRLIGRLRAEMPEKKKIYQSLGILGGILLAVLVW